MKRDFSRNSPSASSHDETDILVLIRNIQQQLGFLEKKIDILVNQSGARPFEAKHRPQSSRPFVPASRHGQAEQHGSNPRERSFSQGRHFDKQRPDENRGFAPRKKPFYTQGRGGR
jgi:hypothetical protein